MSQATALLAMLARNTIPQATHQQPATTPVEIATIGMLAMETQAMRAVQQARRMSIPHKPGVRLTKKLKVALATAVS